MEPDPLAEQAIQVIASHGALAGGELRTIAKREASGDISGNLFGRPTAGREDQDRSEVGEDRPDDGSSDVALDSGRLAGLQGIEGHLLKGDGASVFLDQGNLAAEAPQPFRDRLRVGDASTEQEELGGGWGDG